MTTLAAPTPALQGFNSPATISVTLQPTAGSRLTETLQKLQEKLAGTILGAVKFNWNKISHGLGMENIGATPRLLNNVDGLNYFTGVDEHGVGRGGNLPWLYVDDIYATKVITQNQRYKAMRNTLAHLPSNVSFRFVMSPDVGNLTTLKNAFVDSGFMHLVKQTFIYTPVNDGRELLAQLKSDARSKINAAKRDLEIVSMSVEDYFAFYKENLAAAGKDSWFELDVDRELTEAGMRDDLKQAHIIATRRKATPDNAGPFPIEAAIVLTGGADGFMKLLRITYKREDKANPDFELHKHAVKFLIFESMCRAAASGFKLDTDCFTPGAETLYTRFGVFQLVERHEFQRKSMQLILRRISPLVSRALRKAQVYAFSRLSCLLYQLLFTQYVLQSLQGATL